MAGADSGARAGCRRRPAKLRADVHSAPLTQNIAYAPRVLSIVIGLTVFYFYVTQL